MPKKIVFLGTYDIGKPRVRILLEVARSQGYKVIECHIHLWKGVEDKVQLKGHGAKILYFCRWILSQFYLMVNYLKTDSHDLVIIPYMGHFEVLTLGWLAKLRGVPIVWDVFISLYDTVVVERKLLRKENPLSKALYVSEWLASRVADVIIMDTHSHARYFETLFSLKKERVQRVMVGVEENDFPKCIDQLQVTTTPRLLFYGYLTVFHGVDIIIRAAKILEEEQYPLQWTMIGTGQESENLKTLIKELNVSTISLIDFVPYEELSKYIQEANINLGIFGNTDKGDRVIPNKIFQILASQKPLITADSEAIRELMPEPPWGVSLIQRGNVNALVRAIKEMLSELNLKASDCRIELPVVDKHVIGSQLNEVIKSTLLNKVR